MRVREAADVVAVVGQYTQLKQVGRRLGRAVPVPRREDAVVLGQRRARASTTASAARPRVTSSRSSVRSSTSTSSARSSGWRPRPASRSATPSSARARAGRRAGPARRGDGAGGRLVPRAAADRRPTPARPAATCGPAGFDGDMVRAATGSAGRPTSGTRWPGRCGLSDDGAARHRPRLPQPSVDRQQDVFRARVLFPIFDARGDPVAFGGRILPGGRRPEVQEHRRRRRCTTRARCSTGSTGRKATIVAGPTRSIVCEGYTDVIGLAPAGAAAGGGHVRHGPHRGPRAAAAAVRPPDGAGLRRRRRRPGGGRAVLRVGAQASRSTSPWPILPDGVDPGDLARPTPTRLRGRGRRAHARSSGSGSTGCSAPAALATPEGRARAAEAALGVDRRAPERARARPVRDGGRRPVPPRRRPAPRVAGRAGAAACTAGDRPRSAPAGCRRAGAACETPGDRGAAAGRRTDPGDVADWLLDEVLFADEHAPWPRYRALAAAATFHDARSTRGRPRGGRAAAAAGGRGDRRRAAATSAARWSRRRPRAALADLRGARRRGRRRRSCSRPVASQKLRESMQAARTGSRPGGRWTSW